MMVMLELMSTFDGVACWKHGGHGGVVLCLHVLSCIDVHLLMPCYALIGGIRDVIIGG